MPDELGPLRIVRPDDLLNVTVELTNLRVSADRRFLERIDPVAPAWLAFVLPPQHLSEQAFMEYEDHVRARGPAARRVRRGWAVAAGLRPAQRRGAVAAGRCQPAVLGPVDPSPRG